MAKLQQEVRSNLTIGLGLWWIEIALGQAKETTVTSFPALLHECLPVLRTGFLNRKSLSWPPSEQIYVTVKLVSV